MVVTGAFSSHTTKLYNYYVSPRSWDLSDLKYIDFNFLYVLKYLGEILSGPFNWSFDNEIISGIPSNHVNSEINNVMEKFSSLFNNGDRYIFILKPIINNCCQEKIFVIEEKNLLKEVTDTLKI